MKRTALFLTAAALAALLVGCKAAQPKSVETTVPPAPISETAGEAIPEETVLIAEEVPAPTPGSDGSTVSDGPAVISPAAAEAYLTAIAEFGPPESFNKKYEPNTRCFLEDLDGDGEMELLLNQERQEENAGDYIWAFGLYDFQDGQLVARAESRFIAYQTAGDYGYVSTVTHQGKPVIAVYREYSSNGTGIDDDTVLSCTLLDPVSFEALRTVSCTTPKDGSALRYAIGEETVSEEALVNELKDWPGIVLFDGALMCANSGLSAQEVIGILNSHK